VGLIPYTLSDYTRAVDPLKLLEYLAAGIPVVTSNIPEVAKYAEHVAIAPDDETFIRAVGDALTVDRAATRANGHAVAKQHTWSHRTTELLRIFNEVVQRRGRS
jgi:glycosyltransferase involved in cell wall biosynthesis